MCKGAAKVALVLLFLALAACDNSPLTPTGTPSTVANATPTTGPTLTPILPASPLSIYFAVRDQAPNGTPTSAPYHLFALDASNGRVRWRQPGADPAALGIGEIRPFLSQGVLFIGDEGISAINPATGESYWHYAATGTNMIQAVINGVIYATEVDGFDGTIYALDTFSGQLLWRSNTVTNLRTLHISIMGTYIYAVDSNAPSSLTAYSIVNGAKLWHYQADGNNLMQLQQADGNQAYAVNSTFSAQGPQGFVAVINIHDGSLRWRFPKTGQDDVTVEGLAGGLVYVSSASDQSLEALNASDGTVKWKASVGLVASANLDGDTWYVTSSKGTVYALNAATGTIKWQVQAGQPAQDFDTRLVGINQGLLYVSRTQDGLYALSTSDGSTKWHSTNGALSQGIDYNLLGVANGVVYLDVFNNNVVNPDTLIGLSATNGSPSWSYHVGGNALDSGFTLG